MLEELIRTPSVSGGTGPLSRDVAADGGAVAGFVNVSYYFEYLGDEYVVAEIDLDAASGAAAGLGAGLPPPRTGGGSPRDGW